MMSVFNILFIYLFRVENRRKLSHYKICPQTGWKIKSSSRHKENLSIEIVLLLCCASYFSTKMLFRSILAIRPMKNEHQIFGHLARHFGHNFACFILAQSRSICNKNKRTQFHAIVFVEVLFNCFCKWFAWI